MTYKDKLHPWCIIRPFPDMRSKVIIRFRRRSDAEGHMQILKANNPDADYEIMFDVTAENSTLTDK
ncbi:MAG: hypothetical protein U7123_14840 [Potamolinea sp.]